MTIQTNHQIQNARVWQSKEIHLGLENMKQLLNRMGNPQEELQVIHVAGTNGKGSQIAMMKAILMEAGYHVGTYTSPAVFSPYEVIQVDNRQISKEEYAVYMEKIEEFAKEQKEETGEIPSPFERETALAFWYFQCSRCDVVLLETGMGGDMDATNIITNPLCSMITSISMDHMAFLGNTLTEIAHKKAGIIKRNCPVVISRQEKEVEQILMAQANKMNADYVLTKTERILDLHREREGFRLDYQTEDGHIFHGIYVPFQGNYQVENAINVLEAMEHLKPTLKKITNKGIAEGMKKAKWQGRFECLCRQPDFYIDGAHNPAAALQLGNTMSQLQKPGAKVIYIVGMLKDKEWQKVLDIFMRRKEEQIWIPITIPHNRGLESGKLGTYIREHKKEIPVWETDDIKQAAARALSEAKVQDMIVAFGSLSFLDEIKKSVYAIL